LNLHGFYPKQANGKTIILVPSIVELFTLFAGIKNLAGIFSVSRHFAHN